MQLTLSISLFQNDSVANAAKELLALLLALLSGLHDDAWVWATGIATVMATALRPWPCGFAAFALRPWLCGCCCLGLRASQLQPTELVVDPATVLVMRRGDARCVIAAAFATGILFASLVFVGLRLCSSPCCHRRVEVEVVSRKSGPALTEYVGYTSNDSCTHAYSNCCGMRTFTQVGLCSKCFTLK